MKVVRQDVEALRLLSALGIVWFHTRVAGAEVGYSGLVFFLIATVYFGGNAKTIKQRALRLLVPWALWMIFYGAINFATGKPLVAYADGFVSKLLWGTANHLWFLPFSFVALILFDRIRRTVMDAPLAFVCGALAVLQLATAPWWREPSFSLGFPWSTFVHATPALLLGVFFGGFRSIESPARFVVLVAAIVASAATVSIPDQGLPYLFGILAACLLLLRPVGALQKFHISALSKLSLGIYLIHPFLLDVCLKLGVHLGILQPLMVFVGSAVLVWMMQRLLPRFARYVV